MEKISGKLVKKNGHWWAYCDQYALAAPGSDSEQAVGNMLKMLSLYIKASENGHGPQAVISGNGDQPITFELKSH